jgi:hypothetical protein
MRTSVVRTALLMLALVFPGGALAAVQAGQPFPSNRYTTTDPTQATSLRVNLPQPDCTTHPNDCADVAVLNKLDGFNIQPRISVPFSGPIDVSSVSSNTVFLIGPRLHKVGINQLVWEPAANTLHFESDEQLQPHSTYLLVVTRGVHGRCRPARNRGGQRLHDAVDRRDLEEDPLAASPDAGVVPARLGR